MKMEGQRSRGWIVEAGGRLAEGSADSVVLELGRRWGEWRETKSLGVGALGAILGENLIGEVGPLHHEQHHQQHRTKNSTINSTHYKQHRILNSTINSTAS